MLLATVLFVFALHVVAWMALPAARRAHGESSYVPRPYVPAPAALTLGEVAEG